MNDRTTWACALLLAVAACGGEAAKTDASAKPAGSAAPTAAAKPADAAAKGPATKLVKKDVEAMLDKTFGMERMKEPIDKRVAEVETKLGPPAKTEGDGAYWYMLDGDTCYELKLGKKDGSYTTSGTDKAKCGL
jgi:hypothetical protein